VRLLILSSGEPLLQQAIGGKNMNGFYYRRFVLILTVIGAFALTGPLSFADDNVTGDSDDSVAARILESNGQVGIKGEHLNIAAAGMILEMGDTLNLAEGARVTLILKEGTIAEYDGPGEIIPHLVPTRQDSNIIAKLGTALRNIFLSSNDEKDEATLGVRDPGILQALPLRVPQMLYPPSNIKVMSSPRQLRWQPVEGVIYYAVSVYDKNKPVWEGRTNASYIDLPSPDSILKPGNDYLWVVRTELGDNHLQSRQAVFSVLDETSAAEIRDYIKQIDADVGDEKLRHYLKAELYRDHDLKMECFGEVAAILKSFPDERSALVMQARLLEEMGFLEEAIKAYKSLLNQ